MSCWQRRRNAGAGEEQVMKAHVRELLAETAERRSKCGIGDSGACA